ncbi:ribokinase [Alteribacter populi]|uniref:ribokinase n=1 Tax=Alteribacter populi TaxID=2011011 RepID=UPI000BBB637A|nr:ribokinase [Alteribacter populi]
MTKPTITVIGSINMDMVTNTDIFPSQGETVLGESFSTMPGGKGANQAVAAARLGAQVRMIGRVGDDPFGPVLKQVLSDNGIFSGDVEPVTECSSGVATIILSDRDNRIIVTPGANNHVTPEYVEKFKEEIIKSDIVLLQLEIPLKTIEYVLDLCTEYETTVILNPAPAQLLRKGSWQKATYVTPNETEYNQLFTASIQSDLRSKLIITKGARGASFFDGQHEVEISSYRVEPVDTTGAGDTFNGAFAVAIAEGRALEEAVSFANGAAALSVQKLGAQGGMPTRDQLDRFMEQRQGGGRE